MESWPTNQDRCFGWLDQPWVGASQIGKEKTIAAWYVS